MALTAVLAVMGPAMACEASSVITMGGESAEVGPGVGPGAPAAVPARVDYFTQPVANPTVVVKDKYSYDDMVRDLESLRARYSDRPLQVNVYGASLDGRNLYEVILGNPNSSKHVLIHAGIHGREYMTPLLVMKQLEYGLEFYNTVSYEGVVLSDLLSRVAVHFVPMVNPDGISISQFGLAGLRSPELQTAVQQCYVNDVTYGRTANPLEVYLQYWKANAMGVDLNNNFPADWELVASAPAPSYATYKGGSALEGQESMALANLTNSRKWAATVSYHSMGNLIYSDYPGNRVQRASAELATLAAVSTGYGLAGSSGHGGYKDWVQIKDDPIPSITIETGSVSCPMPVTVFPAVWEQNKMVWAMVAKYVMDH